MRCVAQLVDSNQANIRSGWKNVFGVLGIAASSEREAIVEVSDFLFRAVKKFCSRRAISNILHIAEDPS